MITPTARRAAELAQLQAVVDDHDADAGEKFLTHCEIERLEHVPLLSERLVGAEVVIDDARAALVAAQATKRVRLIADFDAACASELDILSDLRARVAVGDCRQSTVEALDALIETIASIGSTQIADELCAVHALVAVPAVNEVAS